MSEDEPDMSALSREWLAARVVVIGGFIIAIAVALYFALWATPAPAPEQEAAAQTQQPNASDQEAEAGAEHQLCRMELASAQNFGLIPQFGRLSDPNPQKTDVQGRYVCQAETQAAKYQIAADLVCRNLDDPRCVALYSVTQDNGTVLYQRQQ